MPPRCPCAHYLNPFLAHVAPRMSQVIDFGLATFATPTEVLKKHVGTPYYIAPEVWLWAVGLRMFSRELCGPGC